MFVRLLTLINFCSNDNTKGTQMILDFFSWSFSGNPSQKLFRLPHTILHAFLPFYSWSSRENSCVCKQCIPNKAVQIVLLSACYCCYKWNLFGINFTLLHELLATLATFHALRETAFSFKCLSWIGYCCITITLLDLPSTNLTRSHIGLRCVMLSKQQRVKVSYKIQSC